MLIAHTVVLNIAVSVLVEKFTRMSDRVSGYKDISHGQRRWIDLQRLMIKKNLLKQWNQPKDGLRKVFSKIGQSKYFEWTIMFCILVNSITMAMPYLGSQ
jgi:hypothetical protein